MRGSLSCRVVIVSLLLFFCSALAQNSTGITGNLLVTIFYDPTVLLGYNDVAAIQGSVIVLPPLTGAICNLTTDIILQPSDYANVASSGCTWITGSTSNLVAYCDFPLGVHYFDIQFNIMNMYRYNETTFTLSCTDYTAAVPVQSAKFPVNYYPAQLSMEDNGFLPDSIAIANSFVVSQIGLDNFGGDCDQVTCTLNYDQGLNFISYLSGGQQCTSIGNNQVLCMTNSVFGSGGIEFDLQFQVSPNVQTTPQLIRISCIDGFQKYSTSLTASLGILLPLDNTPSLSPIPEVYSSSSALQSWLSLLG